MRRRRGAAVIASALSSIAIVIIVVVGIIAISAIQRTGNQILSTQTSEQSVLSSLASNSIFTLDLVHGALEAIGIGGLAIAVFYIILRMLDR